MNINVIRRADQSRFTEICAAWEQCIKRLKPVVVRIIVATGYVALQAHSGFKKGALESESNFRGGSPRLNFGITEISELINKFEVVIPACFSAPESCAERV